MWKRVLRVRFHEIYVDISCLDLLFVLDFLRIVTTLTVLTALSAPCHSLREYAGWSQAVQHHNAALEIQGPHSCDCQWQTQPFSGSFHHDRQMPSARCQFEKYRRNIRKHKPVRNIKAGRVKLKMGTRANQDPAEGLDTNKYKIKQTIAYSSNAKQKITQVLVQCIWNSKPK